MFNPSSHSQRIQMCTQHIVGASHLAVDGSKLPPPPFLVGNGLGAPQGEMPTHIGAGLPLTLQARNPHNPEGLGCVCSYLVFLPRALLLLFSLHCVLLGPPFCQLTKAIVDSNPVTVALCLSLFPAPHLHDSQNVFFFIMYSKPYCFLGMVGN